jgi:hypothetical protein
MTGSTIMAQSAIIAEGDCSPSEPLGLQRDFVAADLKTVKISLKLNHISVKNRSRQLVVLYFHYSLY